MHIQRERERTREKEIKLKERIREIECSSTKETEKQKRIQVQTSSIDRICKNAYTEGYAVLYIFAAIGENICRRVHHAGRSLGSTLQVSS